MESDSIQRKPEPIGYRAVRDQVTAGLLGPLKVEANKLESDPVVINMLRRAAVKLLPDYGD